VASTDTRYARLIPHFIRAVGVVLFVAHVSIYMTFVGATPADLFSIYFAMTLLSIVPFAGTIVAGSLWLDRSPVPAKQYLRIGGWFAASLGGFLLLNLGMIAIWSEAPLSWNLSWAVWAAAIGGAGGVVAGTLEARSITRAVQAERERLGREAVERRNERLEAFAAVVAHDLRNPLQVASSHLDLARQETESSHHEQIDAALDRMDSIVERTLTLARSGQVIDEPEAVELAPFVTDCWAGVPTADATLTIESSAVIEADPDRLRHLFENLFRNAVEHGSTSPRSQAPEDAVEHDSTSPRSQAPGGSEGQSPSDSRTQSEDAVEYADSTVAVRVGTTEQGFYVADDGPGISPEQRATLFDDTDASGGIGLAIVDRIVDAHGWELDVSDSTDGGARFEVTGVSLSETDTAAQPHQGR